MSTAMDKIPNRENAIVEDLKVTSYLLNPEHVEGGPKANFFFKFGFDRENIEPFKNALKKHAMVRSIAAEKPNNWGVKYELICQIETPDNRNPCILSVWIINNGKEEPRLVTAYYDSEKCK
jgi:hypothetical protein